MKNNEIVKEWFKFADMDLLTAGYLYENMRPKPLEIICYHCQQAVEKMLKGLLLSYGKATQRTHDLGLMAEELFIEETHAKKALENATVLCTWLKGLVQIN